MLIACSELRYVRTRHVLSVCMKLDDLQLQILDFAGQLEDYVSHNLFAQDSEALFCVVADISSPIGTVRSTTSAWCSFIGGISQEKPCVVLAVTHLDKKSESKHAHLASDLSTFMKENHTNINVVGCAHVNYRADRIEHCLQNIQQLLYGILKHIHTHKHIRTHIYTNIHLHTHSHEIRGTNSSSPTN